MPRKQSSNPRFVGIRRHYAILTPRNLDVLLKQYDLCVHRISAIEYIYISLKLEKMSSLRSLQIGDMRLFA